MFHEPNYLENCCCAYSYWRNLNQRIGRQIDALPLSRPLSYNCPISRVPNLSPVQATLTSVHRERSLLGINILYETHRHAQCGGACIPVRQYSHEEILTGFGDMLCYNVQDTVMKHPYYRRPLSNCSISCEATCSLSSGPIANKSPPVRWNLPWAAESIEEISICPGRNLYNLDCNAMLIQS